jgi:hypothetical protein
MLEIVFGLHPGHMDKRKSTLILSHRLNYQGAGPAGQSGGLVGDSKGPGLTVSSVGCLIWGGVGLSLLSGSIEYGLGKRMDGLRSIDLEYGDVAVYSGHLHHESTAEGIHHRVPGNPSLDVTQVSSRPMRSWGRMPRVVH